MEQSSPAVRRLSALTSAMLGFLSLQFLLGMVSALYVTFPDTTDQAKLWHAAWTNWATAGHMVIGTTIVILGVILILIARKAQPAMVSTLTILGLIFVLVAAVGGEEFVRTQHDAYSLLMAVGFIVAMGIYGRLLAMVMVQQARSTPTAPVIS